MVLQFYLPLPPLLSLLHLSLPCLLGKTTSIRLVWLVCILRLVLHTIAEYCNLQYKNQECKDPQNLTTWCTITSLTSSQNLKFNYKQKYGCVMCHSRMHAEVIKSSFSINSLIHINFCRYYVRHYSSNQRVSEPLKKKQF
jgi:hypothetical protein